jgi:glycosyltransferase involved in cell wall biosynthesis
MKSSLRVLHVLGELRPSGAETMFCIAAPLFAKQGVEAEILATGAEMGSYAPQLAQAGYKLHHIPFSKSPGFFIKLYRLMRAGNYDVFHLHTERASFWIGLVALAQRPRRVLQTIHSCFDFRGSLRWRRMIQRRIMRLLGIVHVAISPSVQQTELAHFGLKTRLVCNWYDNNRFFQATDIERVRARESLEIAIGETVVVCVGNCSKIKNHESLLQALAMLPTELRPLLLHVGNEEAGQPERKLAEKLGIGERVRFLGPMADIRPALHAADIFVMPSLIEGFGIAVVEALATGLPTILTDVLGLRDFRLEYEGLCYAKPDASSLREALLVLLNESIEKRRLRAQRYPAISKQHFGIDHGVAGYIEIYNGR